MIEAVRGMRDVLPGDVAAQQHVATRIEGVLASHGYQPVDLPLIERRDLYLRKLGEELVGKVYEFQFNGRDLALRPEWTASVLRAYVARLQDQPLPLRLRYNGPVFRNERPQRGTYRQFTQVGVELIGGPAPRADAECIGLACAGLDAVGVAGAVVRVGQIGLIRSVLAGLGLAERTQGLLVWSLERLRQRGSAAVRAQLAEDVEQEMLAGDVLNGMDDDQAEALLLHALAEIGVNLRFGTRSPEAIVGRLVRKLRRGDTQHNVEQALTLLEQLSQLQGPPAEVLPRAAALLAAYHLPPDELVSLQAVIDLVSAQGLAGHQLVVDFGLGRGLHYYTGSIFEIYTPNGLQLCGGGRYDDLVGALGGRQSVPAVGFAYGLERVVMAAAQPELERPPEVLVVAADDASYAYALRVAQVLRGRGYVAAVDVRGRSVASNLRDAARRGVACAVVGPEEQARGEMLWREPGARDEQRVKLDAM